MTIDNKTMTVIAVGTGTAVTLVGGGLLINHTVQEKRRREEEERQRIVREEMQQMIIEGGTKLIQLALAIIKLIK